MPIPAEKHESQNSKEELEVTGLEIVPVIDSQSPDLQNEVTSILRQMVSETITQLKKKLQVPIAENSNVAVSSNIPDVVSSVQPKRHLMTTSILIGEFRVNFELPEYFSSNNTDMDRIVSSCLNFFVPNEEGKTSPALQYTFNERLENWNIDCRQRPNGRCDVFYRHLTSGKLFRSISEVVNFLLYEVYPDNHRKDNKGPLVENQENPEGIKTDRGQKKRKRTTYKGGRRRKRRRTKAEENNGPAEEEQKSIAEVEDTSEDVRNQEQEKNMSPEGQRKEACTYSELLEISDDWTAYESVLYDYFD